MTNKEKDKGLEYSGNAGENFAKHHNSASVMNQINGNKELYIKLITLAFDNFSAELKNLKRYIEDKDTEKIVYTIHTIKSIGLNLSFPILEKMTKEMEIEMKKKLTEKELFMRYDTLKSEIEYLKSNLNTIIQG